MMKSLNLGFFKKVPCSFVMSTTDSKKLQPGMPCEVAFVGRSNVGKSTLINGLTYRKQLALTSKNPGRTQTLNLFHWGKEFSLVDLPGYGFAKVGKSVRAQWKIIIENYLLERSNLCCVYVLIDNRHPPKDTDFSMIDWLIFCSIPFQLILTKSDKASQGDQHKHETLLKKRYGLNPFKISALKNTGIHSIHRHMVSIWESVHHSSLEKS